MARIDLLADADALSEEGRAVAARIVESRGEVSRPFQVLLHAPALADRVAALGHTVRSGSGLRDEDRELVTLAAGLALGCAFVWDSHVAAASAAGVPDATVAALRGDRSGLDERSTTLVAFVEELCARRAVTEATFGAAQALLGDRGVVELATTVGYYGMLAAVMGVVEAC